MKNIAVIFGGGSVEHDVSIVTGLQAVNILKETKNIYIVYLSTDNKFYLTKYDKPSDFINKVNVIKNSLQITFFDSKIYKVKNKKVKFLANIDGVLNCCHGGVGENGILSSYLQLNNFKVSSSSNFGASVTMDKYSTKVLMEKIGIPVVKGFLVNNNNLGEIKEKLEELKSPYIIKPNKLGSSIGVIKTDKKNIKKDINAVLHLDSDALVENCITDMMELNCAVLKNNNEICVSLIEKVQANKEDILSFEDKYCIKETKREIPANIDKKLEEMVQKYSKQIYESLSLSGVVRIDYIYDNAEKQLYMNEINTVPGSLAFYLFEGLGIDYTMLCDMMLDNSNEIKKQTYFESDILTKTGLKIK